MSKEILKTMIKGVYQLQETRIQIGNQLSAYYRTRHGIKDGEPTDIDCSMNAVQAEFKSIVGDKKVTRRRKYLYEGLIANIGELYLIEMYMELRSKEMSMGRALESILEYFPIYTEFLSNVRGCGPLMSGVIISEFDISKAKYASSLWKYAGLDVGPDGRGRSKRKEHLVDTEYVDRETGEVKTKKGITFNPWLKTKLIGVLGTGFVKQGDKYRTIYDDYKHRLQNAPVHAEKSGGHRHNMAVRYMIKQFLADLYAAWRKIEGLPVHPPYSEAKLGFSHAN